MGPRNKSLAGEKLNETQIFAASLPVYICSGVSPYEDLVHVRRGGGSEEHTWAPNAAAAQLVVRLLGKDSQVRCQHCCPHGKVESECSGAYDPCAAARLSAESYPQYPYLDPSSL